MPNKNFAQGVIGPSHVDKFSKRMDSFDFDLLSYIDNFGVVKGVFIWLEAISIDERQAFLQFNYGAPFSNVPEINLLQKIQVFLRSFNERLYLSAQSTLIAKEYSDAFKRYCASDEGKQYYYELFVKEIISLVLSRRRDIVLQLQENERLECKANTLLNEIHNQCDKQARQMISEEEFSEDEDAFSITIQNVCSKTCNNALCIVLKELNERYQNYQEQLNRYFSHGAFGAHFSNECTLVEWMGISYASAISIVEDYMKDAVTSDFNQKSHIKHGLIEIENRTKRLTADLIELDAILASIKHDCADFGIEISLKDNRVIAKSDRPDQRAIVVTHENLTLKHGQKKQITTVSPSHSMQVSRVSASNALESMPATSVSNQEKPEVSVNTYAMEFYEAITSSKGPILGLKHWLKTATPDGRKAVIDNDDLSFLSNDMQQAIYKVAAQFLAEALEKCKVSEQADAESCTQAFNDYSCQKYPHDQTHPLMAPAEKPHFPMYPLEGSNKIVKTQQDKYRYDLACCYKGSAPAVQGDILINVLCNDRVSVQTDFETVIVQPALNMLIPIAESKHRVVYEKDEVRDRHGERGGEHDERAKIAEKIAGHLFGISKVNTELQYFQAERKRLLDQSNHDNTIRPNTISSAMIDLLASYKNCVDPIKLKKFLSTYKKLAAIHKTRLALISKFGNFSISDREVRDAIVTKLSDAQDITNIKALKTCLAECKNMASYKDVRPRAGIAGFFSGMLAGAGIGAGVGLFALGVGAIPGAIVGAIAGGISGLFGGSVFGARRYHRTQRALASIQDAIYSAEVEHAVDFGDAVVRSLDECESAAELFVDLSSDANVKPETADTELHEAVKKQKINLSSQGQILEVVGNARKVLQDARRSPPLRRRANTFSSPILSETVRKHSKPFFKDDMDLYRQQLVRQNQFTGFLC